MKALRFPFWLLFVLPGKIAAYINYVFTSKYEADVFEVDRWEVRTIHPEVPAGDKHFDVNQWLARGRKREEARKAEAAARREQRRQQFGPRR